MKNLQNKVAAVTGAGSGIGRALAQGLAEKGCHLAISDIDKNGLDETAGSIANKNIKVTTHVVDVADKGQVYKYAEDVREQHGKANIIINNAGVTIVDSLEEVTYEDLDWIFGINLWGVIYGTKAFIPYLKEAGEGHIVNISSINGIVPNPYNGPYCACKFAVKGFTETLIQEFYGSSIGISCVHPGGIRTNIARNSRFRRHASSEVTKEKISAFYDKKLFKTTPEQAATIIIKGIEKNKERVMVGLDAVIMDKVTRCFPNLAKKLFAMALKKPVL